MKGIDENLIADIKNAFDNEGGYSRLESIYDYCHSQKAEHKRKERQGLLIQLIKEGDFFAISLMMMGSSPPELNEKLPQKSIRNLLYLCAEDTTPLFFALQLGQFAVASYIMSYFKTLLHEQPDAELSAYYVFSGTGEDPLHIARKYLKQDALSEQQKADCQLFIDNFFNLLPRQFVEYNPKIFRLWGLVDFYTFVLDQQPSELMRLLEEDAIPAANLRSSAQHLLNLSINRSLYAVFDLLLMRMPDYIQFTQPLIGDDYGDTLLHSCVRQNDAYFLFKMLERDPASVMLNTKNHAIETPLNTAAVLGHRTCRILCKLYATNLSIYSMLCSFINKESERLSNKPDLFSIFRPSKSQGLSAIQHAMDTPEKFFRAFFIRANFSDFDDYLEGKVLFKYVIEKISLVDFSYMNGDKVVSTNLSSILGQNRIVPFIATDALQHLEDEIETKLLPR